MRYGRFKRMAATLLTVVMTIGSVAQIHSQEPAADQTAVLEIDTEKLRHAAEAAVEGTELVIPPELLLVATDCGLAGPGVVGEVEGEYWQENVATPSNGEYQEHLVFTPAEAQRQERTVSTPSDAEGEDGAAPFHTDFIYESPESAKMNFQMPSYELAGGQQLLVNGAAMPWKTSLRVFLEPDMAGYGEDGRYSITGEEALIFMIENQSDDARQYQLQFDDKTTGIVTVESKREMLKQYRKLEEDFASEVIIGELLETTKAPESEEAEPEYALDLATPGNAAAMVQKEGLLQRVRDFVFHPVTAHAATKATSSNADKATDNTDVLEATTVIGLIKSQMDVTDMNAHSTLMTAFSLTDEENEFSPGTANTKSVALTAVTYGAVVRSGDTDTFTINIYDYAPGVTSITTNARWEGAKVINQYLSGKKMNLRFGITPEYKGDDTAIKNDAAKDKKYNGYSFASDGKTKYYNIMQGIADALEADGSEIMNFDTLFPVNVGSSTTIKYGSTDAIRVYENVANNQFLVKDAAGYYEYDSAEKGAVVANNAITASGKGGGFWPFGEKNYYFGMNINCNFYMPLNAQYNNQDMVFKFGGDDDVWVYVTEPDGKRQLVLDLGGIHNVMTGEINFATGCITYFAKDGSTGFGQSPLIHDIQGANKYPEVPIASDAVNTDSANIYVYLYDDFEKLSQEEKSKYCNGGDTAAVLGFPKREGVHKLEFYYLERGAGSSNCNIRFNLPVSQKSGMTVQKHITGQPDVINEKNDQEFTFRLYHSVDKEELKKCHGGQSYDEAKVERRDMTVMGAGSTDLEAVFDRKHEEEYFYLEEIGTDTSQVKWKIGNNEGSGSKTEIQTRTRSDEACFVTFENIYGEPVPTVKKQAWKAYDSESKEAVYDMVLEVSGDSLYRKLPGSDELIRERNVEAVTVTDVLSPEVELLGEDFYLKEGQVTVPPDGASVSDKGNPIEDTSVRVTQDEETGASVVTWNAADELGDDETRTLTFRVKASDAAKWIDGDAYEDTGDRDTGTYSGEAGYYSNDNGRSVLTYGLTSPQSTIPLPKPVIRPGEHGLSLQKTVSGEELNTDAAYEFMIRFQVEAGKTLERDDLNLRFYDEDGEEKTDQDNMSDFAGDTLTVTLRNQEKLVVAGLPRFVSGYEVKENQPVFTNHNRHKAVLQSVTLNGAAASGSSGESSSEESPADVSVEFEAEVQNDKLVFTNRYEYQTGVIRLYKQLWKDAGGTEAYTAKEPAAFTFRITDMTDESLEKALRPVYYATVIVPAGSAEGVCAELRLPVGTYGIEEQSVAGYQLLSGHIKEQDPPADRGQFVTVKLSADAAEDVIFHNKKDYRGYFTDVSTVVNTVSDGGFVKDTSAR